MEPTRELVLAKLREIFADEATAGRVRQALDGYESDGGEAGRARVQLAILKLCAGDAAAVPSLVEQARVDFRDVIAGAEYPEQMRTGASRTNTPAGIAAIERRDREQYLRWLAPAGKDRC